MVPNDKGSRRGATHQHEPAEPTARHGEHPHSGRWAHDTHAGHSVAMFRDKFWVSLLLTLPTLVWGHMLQRALRLVEQAQSSRSRAQSLADRAAFWLTWVALGAGAVTLVGWAEAVRALH